MVLGSAHVTAFYHGIGEALVVDLAKNRFRRPAVRSIRQEDTPGGRGP